MGSSNREGPQEMKEPVELILGRREAARRIQVDDAHTGSVSYGEGNGGGDFNRCSFDWDVCAWDLDACILCRFVSSRRPLAWTFWPLM